MVNRERGFKGNSKGDIVDLPLKEVLERPAFLDRLSGFKVGWECLDADLGLEIEPYILGLWLGDGVRCRPCLCVSDEEIEIANQWISTVVAWDFTVT